jgi:antitoxin component HigA of HigAB toxin-antitoxin module
MTKIKNDRQYHRANKEIEKLFNSSIGTPEYERLMDLVMECESYEWDKFVIPNLRRHQQDSSQNSSLQIYTKDETFEYNRNCSLYVR